MRTAGIIALGVIVSLAPACGRSSGAAPGADDEAALPEQARAVDTLSFGIEGMRRINGAL